MSGGFDYRRIAIFGGPCSGKSTVADRLGSALGVETVHLDDIFWGPNWEPLDKELFRDKVAAIAAGEQWVIDGAYLSVRPQLFESATLVLFLDIPLWTTLKRAVVRTISRNTKFKIGRSMPLPKQVADIGGREKVLGSIISLTKYAFEYRRKHRQILLRTMSDELSETQCHILTSQNQVDEFVRPILK